MSTDPWLQFDKADALTKQIVDIIGPAKARSLLEKRQIVYTYINSKSPDLANRKSNVYPEMFNGLFDGIF